MLLHCFFLLLLLLLCRMLTTCLWNSHNENDQLSPARACAVAYSQSCVYQLVQYMHTFPELPHSHCCSHRAQQSTSKQKGTNCCPAWKNTKKEYCMLNMAECMPNAAVSMHTITNWPCGLVYMKHFWCCIYAISDCCYLQMQRSHWYLQLPPSVKLPEKW